jgi:hypothetical protein
LAVGNLENNQGPKEIKLLFDRKRPEMADLDREPGEFGIDMIDVGRSCPKARIIAKINRCLSCWLS